MKKTSGSNNGNRPGVRSSGAPARNTSRTTTNRSSSPARKTTTTKTATKSSRSKSRKKNNGPKVAVAVGIIAIAAVVGLVWWGVNKDKFGFEKEEKYSVTNNDGTVLELTEAELRSVLTTDQFPQGTVINGVDVSGLTVDAARETVRANEPAAPLSLNISLSLDGSTIPVDLSSLPLNSNIEDILAEAYNYARPTAETPVEDLINMYAQREALKATPAQYNTAYTVNSDGISGIIHGILDPMSHEPVEAAITGFNVNSLTFEYTPSQNGYVIDIDKASNDVKALLDAGTYDGTVTVDAEISVPTLTTEIIQNEYGLIASSHSGTTANNNRNHNIRITCEKIDGLVLQPGEEFSFNNFIGRRTAESGYLPAGTIQGNRIEEDYGGGICQVSSMIYQSVIKSNLEIIERWPHRWPSTYADEGTDAAVDYGSQDFHFRNNSDYPIAIHATYDVDNRIVEVSIYGHQFADGVYIDFIAGGRVSTNQCGTIYVANADLPVGQTSTTGGHNGIVARSYQVWYDANGNEINRIQLDDTVYATIATEVEVGVRNPDGSVATLNTQTGELSGVSAETEATTEATEAPTEPAATETQPTEAPTEPPVTEAPPTEAPATEATEAPAET